MNTLLEVHGLTKRYRNRTTGDVSILRGIDVQIQPGETLCVVGESGCGKTTFGKILAGLIPYSAGSYRFRGEEVAALKGASWTNFRTSVQLIHQNPYESLNPSRMVFDILSAPLRRHRKGITFDALFQETTDLLKMVGLTPVEDFIDKYPANLSGGQRQRVSIARVLSLKPDFIVVDEATSMIDTSLKISLLETLRKIQNEYGVAYLYITHDLALGRYFAHGQRLAVMYLGQIIETGPTEEVISNPHHPYTRALISAGDLEARTEYDLSGVEIPSFHEIPRGCSLSPRCPEAIAGVCQVLEPELLATSPGRRVACHLHNNPDENHEKNREEVCET